MLKILYLPSRTCECGQPATGRLMGAGTPMACDACRAQWERDLALADFAVAARRLTELGIAPPSLEEVLS